MIPPRQPEQPGGSITLDQVRAAVTMSEFDAASAMLRMSPIARPMVREGRTGQPRLAAVLILIYPVAEMLHFALTRRNEYEGVHSGQVSLPGGRAEPGESWEQTALRETCEELGVCDPVDTVQVIGLLTPLYVPPSDFEIHPVVGCLPARPTWNPDPREVAAILEVPLTDLLDDAKKGIGNWTLRSGQPGTVPHYTFGADIVWGATAVILSEFEGRLRAVTA